MKTATKVFAIALMLTTIGCDRLTKHIAATRLADAPMQSYLGDVLRVEYAENAGAFLSLGASLPAWARTGLLTFGAAIGLAAVAIAVYKLRWAGAAFIGAILFLAGGASNLIDRVMNGSVVDFMSVGLGAWRTGIFNVADVALMAGAVLILLGRSSR